MMLQKRLHLSIILEKSDTRRKDEKRGSGDVARTGKPGRSPHAPTAMLHLCFSNGWLRSPEHVKVYDVASAVRHGLVDNLTSPDEVLVRLSGPLQTLIRTTFSLEEKSWFSFLTFPKDQP